MEHLEIGNLQNGLIDFVAPIEDKSKNIIKVIGVGGGGQNAVGNMYEEGIANVTFAVCNTDTQALSKSPVPVKIAIGTLGAGGDPKRGQQAAIDHAEQIEHLLDDGTQMVFVTAGMGGGTGTGAAPVVAGIAKKKGILTIGIVTIPFFFEKKNKIVKALKGVAEMRKNVDALLIINNERICDVYADSDISIKESFKRADQILSNATKSISELITVEGDINLDFCDVETTLRGGGGAIMAMGRGRGEHRVAKAVIDALESPLLYGSDIDKASRILFNIYTDERHPLFVSEMEEIDSFMDMLDPNIDVIWGVSDDNTLDEDAKVTILATGFEDTLHLEELGNDQLMSKEYVENLIGQLYTPYKKKNWDLATMKPITPVQQTPDEVSINIQLPTDNDTDDTTEAPKEAVRETEASITATGQEPQMEPQMEPQETVALEEPLPRPTEEPATEEETDAPTPPIELSVNQPTHTATTGSTNNRPTHHPKHTMRMSFLQRAKSFMDKITELTQDEEGQ